MSHNHQDPKTFLNKAIASRGRSGAEGAYLTNLTIVAEGNVDYGYRANVMRTQAFYPPFPFNLEEWLKLLVTLRNNLSTPIHITTDEATFQFIPDGGQISLNVFIPSITTDTFEIYVLQCQDMLQYVCNFAGKIPVSIRFSIGYALKAWCSMVEDGEAEEQDFTF